MDQALTMRVRREPGYVTITVAGEIDFATVSRLQARLLPLAAAGCPLVVDLNLVSFIDAAGLGALASAARRAAVHGTSLHVVCARRQIRRLFRITGLDLPLAGTLAEALRGAAGRAAAGLGNRRSRSRLTGRGLAAATRGGVGMRLNSARRRAPDRAPA